MPDLNRSAKEVRASPPILNRSGYLLEEDALWLLQKDGWVSIALRDIAQVKQVSVATTALRLADGRKKTLTVSHLSAKGLSAVVAALKKAAHEHRVTNAIAARKQNRFRFEVRQDEGAGGGR